MNNGWSEHHQRLAMNEIDVLCRKLDDIKRIALKKDGEEAFREMVVPLEAACPQAARDEGVTSPEEEQQIGGS